MDIEKYDRLTNCIDMKINYISEFLSLEYLL